MTRQQKKYLEEWISAYPATEARFRYLAALGTSPDMDVKVDRREKDAGAPDPVFGEVWERELHTAATEEAQSLVAREQEAMRQTIQWMTETWRVLDPLQRYLVQTYYWGHATQTEMLEELAMCRESGRFAPRRVPRSWPTVRRMLDAILETFREVGHIETDEAAPTAAVAAHQGGN